MFLYGSQEFPTDPQMIPISFDQAQQMYHQLWQQQQLVNQYYYGMLEPSVIPTLNTNYRADSNNVREGKPSWRSRCKESKMELNLSEVIASSGQGKRRRGKWTQVACSMTPLSKPTKSDIPPTPIVRRGKEREKPARKKPSTLKRLIIQGRKEQEQKRDLMDWKLDCADTTCNKTEQLAKQQIHNRRFRDYCRHSLRPEINRECTLLLKVISDFQHRAYLRDPTKARAKRRYVVGIRQTTKFLKAKLLRCVIVAPNCEQVQVDGGLDDMIKEIADSCEEQDILCIFALNRKDLGKCLSLSVPVSVVGLIDFSGAEVIFKRLKCLIGEAREEYQQLLKDTMEKIDAGIPIRQGPSHPNTYDFSDHEDKSNRQNPQHTRNLSDSFQLEPPTNRTMGHNRNLSDICAHQTTVETNDAADIFKGHSRNPSLISNVSTQPDCGELLNEYQHRIQVEFADTEESNVIKDAADSILCSIQENDDAGIHGDYYNSSDSDDSSIRERLHKLL